MGRVKISALIGLLVILLCSTGCSGYDNAVSQKEVANEAEEPEVYKINEPIAFGDIEYTVLSFEESKEYNGRETDNKFVVVTVNAQNIGKEPATIDSNNFILIDDENRLYETDPTRDISFTHDNYFSLVHSINPGLSKKGLISFEVPEGVNSYILGIRDNMFDFGGAEYRYVVLKQE